VRLVDGCEFRGRRDRAAIVVYPPGLGDETLRQVGRVASRGERPCTVWFWADPTLAPEAPPTPGRPMSEAQADAAVAVYLGRTAEGAGRCRCRWAGQPRASLSAREMRQAGHQPGR
jgi:hypothetical protein